MRTVCHYLNGKNINAFTEVALVFAHVVDPGAARSWNERRNDEMRRNRTFVNAGK